MGTSDRCGTLQLCRNELSKKFYGLTNDDVVRYMCSRMTRDYYDKALCLYKARIRFWDCDGFEYICYVEVGDERARVYLRSTFRGKLNERKFNVRHADLFAEWTRRLKVGLPHADNYLLFFSV